MVSGGKAFPVMVLALLWPTATACGLHQNGISMESPLSFLNTRSVSPPASETSTAQPSAVRAADAPAFADVLSGHSLKFQRQHLAALGTPTAGLQEVPLSDKLTVITSDAPLPDMASLAQFARAQGLDESAVQALFGACSTPITTSALVPEVLAAADITAPQSAEAEVAMGSPGTSDWAAAGVQINIISAQPAATSTPAMVPPAPLATVAPLNPPGTPTSPALHLPSAPTVAPTVPGGLSVQELLASPQLRASAMAPTIAPASIAATTELPSGLMPMTGQAWVGTASTASVDADAPVATATPQEAVRLTLAMPAPEITKRLAQMSGTGKASTWAALLAAGPLSKELATTPSEALALEVPPDYDLGLAASASETATAGGKEIPLPAPSAAPQAVAGAGSGSNADSNTGNAQAQADHRAQQFQQIADQMGQAAAQRLIAQIERGQWKMQLRMQPAALGNIKVELDMHAGGLDALFSTDNAVTRELMVQGSHKLRSTLADAGMTVASVTVNGEQNRQSGGNSTPGRQRGLPSAVRSASGVAPAASDGLNVLA